MRSPATNSRQFMSYGHIASQASCGCAISPIAAQMESSSRARRGSPPCPARPALSACGLSLKGRPGPATLSRSGVSPLPVTKSGAMTMRSASWVGRNWPPMRSESSFGVLLRLATLNFLEATQTRQFLVGHGGNYSRHDFYRVPCVDAPQVRAKLGWVWVPPEQWLDGPIQQLHSLLWAPQLRYCPLCMQSGFHSVWFQLAALQVCPLHGCRIDDTCMACGAPIGPYRWTREMFERAGYCSHCHRPFVGAPFRLADHDEFYQHRDSVERAFAAFQDWIGLVHQKLVFLNHAATGCRFDGGDEERAAVVTGAIHEIVPYPTGCVSQSGVPVSFYCWRTCLTKVVLRQTHPSREGYLTGKFAIQVYRATLRKLYRDVVGDQLPGGTPMQLMFTDDRSASLEKWSDCRLALILLRCAFETPCVLDLATRIDSARLKDDALVPALIGHTLQRGACRAVILAVYAMLIMRARQYLVMGYLSRSRLVTQPADLLLWATCAVGPELYGIAIMPAVPGIDRFTSDRSGWACPQCIARINEQVNRERGGRMARDWSNALAAPEQGAGDCDTLRD